jgi:hypothetical protein
MTFFLFIIFVAILAITLIISGVVAHYKPGRRTAGWWAGI